MEFAVNYSPLLAELVREGQVQLDRFKCPAWPDLVEEARALLPVYTHFPLIIGSGAGMPVDDERHAPADLGAVAAIREMSGTPLINTHFIPMERDYPGVSRWTREPAHIEQILSAALRDLEPLLERFGPQMVTIENVINQPGWMEMAVFPEVLARLLDRSGCGLLLDFSHARITAQNLGIDEHAYIDSLPVDRIREVHVTGLQRMEGALYERLMAAGNPGGFAGRLAGRMMDHLPMQPDDWTELEWAAGRIHSGAWAQPWVMASEIGGVGGFWELVTDRQMYLDLVPRMGALVRGEAREQPAG